MFGVGFCGQVRNCSFEDFGFQLVVNCSELLIQTECLDPGLN